MLCLSCHNENPVTQRFCLHCQARLPWVPPDTGPGLELEESTEYLTPERHYANEYLSEFQLTAFAYLDGVVELSELLSHYRGLALRLERFVRAEVPCWLARLAAEQLDWPAYLYPSQMSYLLRKGCFDTRAGMSCMEAFQAEPEGERLLLALRMLQTGHDHFALAWELLAARAEALEIEARRRQLEPLEPAA